MKNIKRLLFLVMIYHTRMYAPSTDNGSASGASWASACLTHKAVAALERDLKISYATLSQKGHDPHSALCEQALEQNTANKLAQSAVLTYQSQAKSAKILRPMHSTHAKEINEDEATRKYAQALIDAWVRGMRDKDVHDLSEVEKVVLARHGSAKVKEPEGMGKDGSFKRHCIQYLMCGSVGLVIGFILTRTMK